MTPGEVVTEFIHRIERGDVEAASELLADDVLYDNVPMEPKFNGRAAVVDVLKMFVGSPTEWRVFRQSETGNVVMNERLDRIELGGKPVEIPCAGIWEVNDQGRISLWRDYFDLATFNNQL